MITLILNIKHLNDSLQVGDLVYAGAASAGIYSGISGGELESASTGAPNIVGILSKIEITSPTVITLHVDETQFINAYVPYPGDFIMFSKYSQTKGDVIGYYAQAKFINNSREKAEIYSVGSEVIINSK